MHRLMVALVVAACGDDGATDVDAGPDADLGMDMTLVPQGCVLERATTNRPDDHGFDQVRVLYVLPSDVTDQNRDTSGQICNSVRGWATWFHEQTGSYLRLDTAGGLIDIGFVRLSRTDVDMRGTDAQNLTEEEGIAFVRNRIENELVAMQMIESNKLYAVYYEGSSTYACGAGAYPPLIVARVGVMYLNGLPIGQSVPCGQSFPWGQASLKPSYIDYGMLHELVHSMGVVSPAAPHQHTVGHVYDTGVAQPNRDLMYSPRQGMPDPGWATNDPAGLVLDIGQDDYWNAPVNVRLEKMSLLSPLPENAVRPNGW